MVKRLHVLCAQEYEGTAMRVVPCERGRCPNWDRARVRCVVDTGAEHFPVETGPAPACPIQDRCQHQIQAGDRPCPVRARGMLCESVVGADDPRSFHAMMVADPEELAERMAKRP